MMIMTQSMYNIISTSIAVSLSVNDRVSFSWTQFWGDFGASWWSSWDQIKVQFGEYFENKPKPKECFSWKVSSNARQKISWILYHNLLSFFEWGKIQTQQNLNHGHFVCKCASACHKQCGLRRYVGEITNWRDQLLSFHSQLRLIVRSTVQSLQVFLAFAIYINIYNVHNQDFYERYSRRQS